MSKKGVLAAAMSGGVDSSVAAALALEAGYEVIGITLELQERDQQGEACGSVDDFTQVKAVAAALGIEHRFLDLKTQFREHVLAYSWRQYREGRTPNPCAMCNFYLKFGILADYARSLGAEGLITGHYAILNHEKGELRHAADAGKDQVYFLALLTREQLKFSRMPLGNMTKNEVRKRAAELGLPNAQKKESQDACFGSEGESFPYSLGTYFNESMPPGNIVDCSGKVLGRHQGIHQYTIGQRKGLGVAMGKPAYVIGIDAVNNRVVLSTDADLLLVDEIEVSGINRIVDGPEEFKCEVQTRYRQQPVPGVVRIMPDRRALVRLEKPVSAPAIGQVAAFYDGDLVLGGGIIAKINQG